MTTRNMSARSSGSKKTAPEGFDKNPENIRHTPEQKEKEWEFVVKMTLICRDIMLGNDKLNDVRPVGAEAEHSGPKDGWHEEARPQRHTRRLPGSAPVTDFMPNGDFTEAMLNTTFDWNGKKEPLTFATENDGLNGLSMLLGKLVTGRASLFADVRTYWSPDAVERVCGMRPEGVAKDGFIHLINSGAAALDATGVCKDKRRQRGHEGVVERHRRGYQRYAQGYRLVPRRPRIFQRRRILLALQDSGCHAHDNDKSQHHQGSLARCFR